jgi:cytochrome b561
LNQQQDIKRAAPAGGYTMRPPLLAALHWATATLVVLGLALILVREIVEAKTGRASLLQMHRWCGLLVLGLTVWRVGLRLRFGPLPDLLPRRSAGARFVARAVHTLLYGLLFCVPVLGWCLSSADGQRIDLFGLPLPLPIAADEDVADKLHTWHTAMAWTFASLIAAHAAAACWHQFLRREPILRAMWPWHLSTHNRGDSP